MSRRGGPNQLVEGPGEGLAGPGAARMSHSLGNLGAMLEELPDSLPVGSTACGRDPQGQLVCVEETQRLRRMLLCFLRRMLAERLF